MGIFSFFKSKNTSDESYDSLEENEISIDLEESEAYYKAEDNVKEEFLNLKMEDIIVEEISPEKLEEIITNRIVNVIENYKDFDYVQPFVKRATIEIGKRNVELLKDYLTRGKVSKPQRLKKQYEELGSWGKAVENAVLTILYGFEADGVDELLKIANSHFEIRFKAINLLCKLASRGIEREKIIDSIIYIMKPFNEDEILQVLNFLSQIKNSSKVLRLLDLYYRKYILENNLECAYDTLISKINFKGTFTEEELIFLKVLALHEGKLDISFVLPEEDSIIDFSNIDESIRVKAAVSYYSLDKEDKEINYRLLYLRDNSLEDEIRRFLNEVIS